RNVDVKNVSQSVFTKEHQQTALDIARRGIVLLKNRNNMLPIEAARYKNILVTGPNADNQSIMGDWVFEQPRTNYKTILDGIQALSEERNVHYVDVGWNLRELDDSAIDKAIAVAKDMDLIILALGEDSFRQHWKE